MRVPWFDVSVKHSPRVYVRQRRGHTLEDQKEMRQREWQEFVEWSARCEFDQ